MNSTSSLPRGAGGAYQASLAQKSNASVSHSKNRFVLNGNLGNIASYDETVSNTGLQLSLQRCHRDQSPFLSDKGQNQKKKAGSLSEYNQETTNGSVFPVASP